MNSRRTTTNEDHFDLLPFITILLCVLGTLLLVTMSLAAISLGPGVGEGWVPAARSGSQSKTPVLLEWDGESLVAHWPEGKQRGQWTQRISIGGKTYRLGTPDSNGQYGLVETKDTTADAWDRILERLERLKATHYALFAVRPSGFSNFQLATREFRDRRIDIGYEPIEQGKSVRLLREVRREEAR